LTNMIKLPRNGRECYRWMLGACQLIPNDVCMCFVQPENRHPSSSHIPDNFARDLADLLHPGKSKMVADSGAKRYKA